MEGHLIIYTARMDEESFGKVENEMENTKGWRKREGWNAI